MDRFLKMIWLVCGLLFLACAAHAQLIFLQEENNADGKSQVYYEKGSVMRSADGRFLSADIVTNYASIKNVDGHKYKSIKSKVSYDCNGYKMKPGDETYYANDNAQGQVAYSNKVDKNIQYLDVFMESYKSMIKKVCADR